MKKFSMATLSFLKYLSLLFVIIVLLPNSVSSHADLTQSRNHVALFIFGDSLFDAGNNNYINTSYQANVWPYGETFFNYPTGRFSDGRLIPDFIAENAKLPLLPPYKQPSINHQFTNGANFASAGAGALNHTHQGMVIDLNMQLNDFKNVKKVLVHQLGDIEANKMLSRAVYLFSIGSNDYMSPFMANSSFFQLNSPEEYVEMVIGNTTDVIKEIFKSGGRKFGFVSLGPLDCTPLVRVLNPAGECMEQIAALVKLHNTVFSKVLKNLGSQLQGFKYSNFDFYNSAAERIENPSKYGFENGNSACCGSGVYRGVNSCGGKRGVKEYELCSNASEYVFFDAGHPSESANEQLAQLMWKGNSKIVKPYNLEALFEQL